MAAGPNTSSSRGIDLEFAQASDPGLDPAKRVNEDSCGYSETQFGHLFVICDGMGGHAGGKQASDIAIRTVFDCVSRSALETPPKQVLAHAVEQAAKRVYEFGGPASNLQRPGSTCVAMLLHDGRCDVAHVGDSRAYAIRGNQIYRLTRDHSMVQELLDNGVITEQEAIGHPDSNKITRALGMTPEVEVELRDEPMEVYEGDIFLLATDGLTDLARNDDILVTVSEYMPSRGIQSVCDELVALANRRGGHDNITVQAVRVLKAGPKSSPTLAQGPAGVPAGSRVATTVDGAPATPAPIVGETVVQEPHFGAVEPPGPTVPDEPAHIVSSPFDDRLPYDSAPLAPAPGPRPPPLTYLVLGMAAIIGVLLALLMWALFYR